MPAQGKDVEISVVIPCSRKGPLLQHTAARIPRRSTVEILIVLSNSDRSTRAVARALSVESAQTRVIDIGKQGVCKARNVGLQEASGRSTLLLDADILVPQDFVESRIDRHSNLQPRDMLVSLIRNYDVGPKDDYRRNLLERISPEEATFKSAHPWMHGHAAAVSFKREALLDERGGVDLFDERFAGWGGEDQEWLLRLPCRTRILVDLVHEGVHQPHPRDWIEQVGSYRRNLRHFIRRHPLRIVECLAVFGCRCAETAMARLDDLVNERGALGRLVSSDSSVVNLGLDGAFFGFFLPYCEGAFRRAEINGTVLKGLPRQLQHLLLAEITRVAVEVHVTPPIMWSDAPMDDWKGLLSDFALILGGEENPASPSASKPVARPRTRGTLSSTACYMPQPSLCAAGRGLPTRLTTQQHTPLITALSPRTRPSAVRRQEGTTHVPLPAQKHPCAVCHACQATSGSVPTRPGGSACRLAILSKFAAGSWHNGVSWHGLRRGRALTQATLIRRDSFRRARNRNHSTETSVTRNLAAEHEAVFHDWSVLFPAFRHQDEFKLYMATHPFARIVEFRKGAELIGFNWIILLEPLVIYQLFPWRKTQHADLLLGYFCVDECLGLWPSCIHLLGEDGEFKRALGGWTYST